MAASDSQRSTEELIADDAPTNSQMEVGQDKRARPISLCAECSKLSRNREGCVPNAAIGVVRRNEKLTPVCRLHRGGEPLMSFRDAWEEWCVQSVQES